MEFKTKKEALKIVISLSNTSKMPSKSYGLPAKECKTGSKLRKVSGSVCESCYACKGLYQFKNVQESQYKRLESIKNPLWADAIIKLIGNDKFFRWHDSGDLQSMEHLKKIVGIAERLPNTSFWLPTKEKGLINKYLKTFGAFPANLVVRLSAAMVDSVTSLQGINTSSVHDKKPAFGFECKAPSQNGECRDCRACWDSSIKNVSYARH